MDRYYNKLLAGAVARTTAIEDRYDEVWLGMTHDITRESRTLFRIPGTMTAGNQMALFLYLPVVIVGIVYIIAVGEWFRPSYKSSSGPATVIGAEKAPTASQNSKSPQIEQPSVVPDKQQAPGITRGTEGERRQEIPKAK